MKRLLTTLVILMGMFAPSLAVGEERVKYGDLVERGGIFYKKFTDEPFTGKTTGRKQITFRRGKSEGPYVSYHENGQLLEKGSYKDGKPEGPWVSYWDNGQFRSKGNYKDGKKEGPWIQEIFHHTIVKGILGDWRITKKWTNKNGKREGSWIGYHDNGQVKSKGTYKDGEEEGPFVGYHENGQLERKGNYKDGKPEGPWVFYKKDGTKDMDGKSEDWNVISFDWHEGTGTYRNGKKVSD
jgi:antitoxin component YwqK of YwqJK toxin-antitoxin module